MSEIISYGRRGQVVIRQYQLKDPRSICDDIRRHHGRACRAGAGSILMAFLCVVRLQTFTGKRDHQVEYHGKKPKIGKDVFIAPGAVVLGDVEIGDGSSIWYGAVVRGDESKIRIGRNTNIQDNCTLHSDPPSPLTIGDNVTVGHNAVVHGCTIEDDCLIGIASIILNDAQVKRGSIVASGSVVKQRQVVGPSHLVAGIPAEVKKKLTQEDMEDNRDNARTYCELARKHMAAYSGNS